jgi:phosphate transport system permease protein
MSPESPSQALSSGDDAGFRLGTGLVASFVLLVVTGIFVTLCVTSRLAISKFGFSFWTGRNWDPVVGDFGALPFIWGTLYSSFLALLLSTPIAIGIAIFLSELSPQGLRQPLIFLTELLAAIPSIIYGLWGIFVLIPVVRRVEGWTPDALKGFPLFTGPPLGVGLLAAALVLAVMITPYTATVAREILKAVPFTQREAAYALGATRWEAIRMALYYGRTGVIGAVMLGLGRALGETMAVTMVIGNNPQISASLFAPQYTMAAVIANEFTEAANDLYLHALVEIGLVLFVVTVGINTLSQLLIWSVSGKRRPRKIPVGIVQEARA